MSEKQKTIGRKIVDGLRELNGKLKRGDPIEATRVQRRGKKVTRKKVIWHPIDKKWDEVL